MNPLAKKNSLLPCGRQRPEKSETPKDVSLADWQVKLRDFLKAKNLKYTDQRWQITKLIFESGLHLDAKNIVERIKVHHPHIGHATVYRSLKILVEAGILEESMQSARGTVIYEFVSDDHHDHIICIDCGEIFEFHSEKIEQLQSGVARKMGFVPREHRHVIQASCDYLAKKNATKST